MSLLMDALKRAEKARQAEAAREADGDNPSDSGELSLHPLEDRPEADKTPAPPAKPPPEPPSQQASESSNGLNFSLDDDDMPAAPRSPAKSDTTEHLGPFSLVDDDDIAMEDTGEMQPIAREAEEAVKKYFDETNSMSLDVDEIRSELDEDTVAGTQPLPAEELARQTAQTMFDAKAPAARGRGRRAALVVVPLFLVLFLGVSGFFLWDDLVRLFVGPPPLVSRRPLPPVPVETTTPPSRETARAEPAPPPAAGSGSSELASAAPTGTGPEAPAVAGTADGSAFNEKLAAAAEAAVAESAAGTPQAGEQPIPDKPAASAAGTTAGKSPLPPPEGAADKRVAALTEQALSPSAGAAGYASMPVPTLRISRKTSADRVHPTLQSAYDAFNQGDNARARSLYEKVLAGDAQNRDALLGIGAIETRAGDVQAARQTYARLLSLNPRDPIARAALIDSHQDVSPVEGESHIKQLLSQDPSRPFLYSTLGNLYARQARWPEAQKAYFDAYRLDSKNPDYAFNLAVSLDQIGQPAAALSYYRRALELAEGGQASFEAEVVLKRIASLTMAGNG